jgi:hypothetical protein
LIARTGCKQSAGRIGKRSIDEERAAVLRRLGESLVELRQLIIPTDQP